MHARSERGIKIVIFYGREQPPPKNLNAAVKVTQI